nr:hypothetical protein HK105_005009 [Polyrhizophydium stewartii]
MFEIALSRDDALGVLDEHLRERFNALLSGVSEHLAAETGHRLVQVPRISIPSDGVDIHFDRPIESHCLFGECFAGMLSGEVVDVEFPCGIDTADAVVSFGRSMSRVSRQTHPSLLRPLRVCLNSDRPFVVTQPARRSVSSMLEGSSPLSIVDRVRVVLAIASLLNSLHSLHPPIVHGGLSAECVVVDDAGNAKIAHTAMATIAGGSAHLLSMGIKGEIPQDIGRLNHLVTLNLAGNILTTLHPEIGRLKLLTELRLGSNRLTSLPSTIGDLAQLETLDCSSNLIKSFPEKICNLVRLKTLKLCNNQIQSIPYNLGRLTRLKLLAIQNNKIMELPDSLSNLVELEELYINNNSGPFQKLPDLTPLKYLRVLNIAHNPITSLPDSFTRLVNLEYLRFEKNDPVIPKQVRWAFYAKL